MPGGWDESCTPGKLYTDIAYHVLRVFSYRNRFTKVEFQLQMLKNAKYNTDMATLTIGKTKTKYWYSKKAIIL